MNCPNCGAHNPSGADFCSLCLTSLAVEPERPGTPVSADVDAPGAEDAAPDATDAGPAPASADGGDTRQVVSEQERFRKTEEGLEWACDRCQTWNPLEVLSCTVCGRSFREQLTGASAERTAVDDPARMRNLSLLLPGLGHILMGDPMMGLARMIVALLWLIGGVSLILEAGSAGQSPLPALPLFFGAIAMWAVTYVDASSLAEGRSRQWLDSRRFLWLFIGVMVASMLMFFPGFLAARS